LRSTSKQIDETHTRVNVRELLTRFRSQGNFGLLALIGVQSNPYVRVSISLACSGPPAFRLQSMDFTYLVACRCLMVPSNSTRAGISAFRCSPLKLRAAWTWRCRMPQPEVLRLSMILRRTCWTWKARRCPSFPSDISRGHLVEFELRCRSRLPLSGSVPQHDQRARASRASATRTTSTSENSSSPRTISRATGRESRFSTAWSHCARGKGARSV
jgi:hypothetical protein